MIPAQSVQNYSHVYGNVVACVTLLIHHTVGKPCMAFPSGVYIIENVRNRNWAILTNDNDGDDVTSGTDADTDEGHKVE
jgi:hypothetical protein